MLLQSRRNFQSPVLFGLGGGGGAALDFMGLVQDDPVPADAVQRRLRQVHPVPRPCQAALEPAWGRGRTKNQPFQCSAPHLLPMFGLLPIIPQRMTVGRWLEKNCLGASGSRAFFSVHRLELSGPHLGRTRCGKIGCANELQKATQVKPKI